MIFGPPAAPAVSTGWLFLSRTMVGLILDSGRFLGPTAFAFEPTSPKAFGVPGAMAKSSISLLSITPVPGTVTLQPQEVLTVQVMATQFPSESAVVRWVVCFLSDSEFSVVGVGVLDELSWLGTVPGGLPYWISLVALSRRKSLIRSARYGASRRVWGTLTKSLSPSQYARSANALFIVSIRT